MRLFKPLTTSRHLLDFCFQYNVNFMYFYILTLQGKKAKNGGVLPNRNRLRIYRSASQHGIFSIALWFWFLKLPLPGVIRSSSWCYHNNQWYTFIDLQRKANWFVPDDNQRACCAITKCFIWITMNKLIIIFYSICQSIAWIRNFFNILGFFLFLKKENPQVNIC